MRVLTVLAALLALAAPAQAADFLVTNSFDVGAGSLRQAILNANATANSGGPDTISFGDLSVAPKITPDTPLPTIIDPVIIDGYTHPGASANTQNVGNNAVLKVELSGEDFLSGTPIGLRIASGNSTVRGLVINRFDGPAIQIDGNGGSVVEGNFIGTNVAGTGDLTAVPGDAADGVLVANSSANTIGGSTAAARNVISGLGHDGVVISGAAGNLVQGNYIGTVKAGTAALGNDRHGIRVDGGSSDTTIGGATVPARNVISANSNGVFIEGDATVRTVVRGNFIGTNAGGTGDLGNTGIGVDSFKADGGVIGGSSAGEGNLISGNGSAGVNIRGGFDPVAQATGNVVQGNRIGTNAAGTAALANGFDGMQVHSNAVGTTIGGLVPRARNVISGNDGNGAFLSDRDAVFQGNYVGTNAAGDAAVPNAKDGIVAAANFLVLGGTEAAARNVVSGNAGNGIFALAFTEILGNYVGINAAGTDAVPNRNGIEIRNQTFVGGRDPIPTPGEGAGNVISGNQEAGILISDGGNVEIDGNLIGTNPTGTGAIPNADGVVIEGDTGGHVLGFSSRNVISGNDFAGVQIRGTGFGRNSLIENHIGLNRARTGAIPNGVGVEISDGASGNVIGPFDAPKRNLIAGNRFEGIHIHGNGTERNSVRNAFVGLLPNGTALPNARGIAISDGAGRNTIGGSSAADGNTISGNRLDGVLIRGAETNRNVVRGNTIGLTPDGSAARPNNVGVHLAGGTRFNTVGGALGAPQSLISGNRNAGVRVADPETLGNRIQGNHIGTAPNGSNARPNGVGVVITGGAQATTIGGLGSLGNRIALNTGSGVLIDGTDTAGAELVRNKFFGNGKLAINLRPAGEAADAVTPNDALDADLGPNGLQNFPAITSAAGSAGGTTIAGTLSSLPNTSFRIEVFRSPASGDVEAETLAGVVTVTTNGAGTTPWNLALGSDFSGQVLRATATNLDTLDTSELSQTRAVG